MNSTGPQTGTGRRRRLGCGPAASGLWIGLCLAVLAPLRLPCGWEPPRVEPGEISSRAPFVLGALANAGVYGADSSDSLLTAARRASRADEHAAAIAAFRRLLERDPQARDSLAPELGAQLTWAGRYREALDELGWFLQRHPDRSDIWSLRALAGAWSGHPAEALRDYRRARRADPSDLGAWRGEARMLAWLGESDESRREYEKLLEAHPGDSHGWVDLARLHHWNGRPDLALAALDQAEAREPASEAARDLRAEVTEPWRPRATATWGWAEDSDDFSSRSWRLEVEIPVAFRGHLRGGWLGNQFRRESFGRQQDGWLFVSGDYRMSTPFLVSGGLQVQLDRPDQAGYVPLTGDLNLGWFAHDRLRADLSGSHFALFTFETYPGRVSGNQVGGGITWRSPGFVTLTGAGDYTDYSDNNERVQLRAAGRWGTRPWGARLDLTAGVAWRDTRRWTGHGIWNPDRNEVWHLRSDVGRNLAGSLWADAFVEWGWGKEGRAPLTPYHSAGGGLSWTIGGIRLDARAAHYGPYERIRAGYKRDSASLGISRGF